MQKHIKNPLKKISVKKTRSKAKSSTRKTPNSGYPEPQGTGNKINGYTDPGKKNQ